MSTVCHLDGRSIGVCQPVYVVAELSANHHQQYETAVALVRAAAEAGADAVKLQTYTPDTLTIDCRNEWFRIGPGTIWSGRYLYDLYREACTPWEWTAPLQALARELGMALFSTPFDATAVDYLEGLDVPAHKVASFELVDLPLLRKIGATGKPVILSTGMATLAEIDEAVRTLKGAGTCELVLLKCTSSYPASPDDMNLRTIPHMSAAFDVPVGLSDHTLGSAASVAAVALGACMVEKHLTLDRREPGPDAAFSAEPAEFKAMVEAIRATERALGAVSYEPTAGERASRVFRRSLFVVEDVQAGAAFTTVNVRSIRPGQGLHPRYLEAVLGRRARHGILRGTPLRWDMVS